MSQTYTETDHPRDDAGKFANKNHQDQPHGLTTLAPTSHVGEFEMNETFPIPQANDLDKVAAAVSAISKGADSHEAVAIALDVEPRQGAYYADAAGYLGFAEVVHGVTPKQYTLTGIGEEFTALEEAGADTDRTDLLKRVVASAPTVQAIVDDDEDSARFIIEMDDLSEATVDRRMATARSWAAQIGSVDLAGAVRATGASVRTRTAQAAAVAAEARRLVRESQKERPVAICTTCGLQLPGTGVCDECDW